MPDPVLDPLNAAKLSIDSAIQAYTTAQTPPPPPPVNVLPDVIIKPGSIYASPPIVDGVLTVAAGTEVHFGCFVKNDAPRDPANLESGKTPTDVIVGVEQDMDVRDVAHMFAWADSQTHSILAQDEVDCPANSGPQRKATWTATPGDHEVFMVVDNINRFAESNEGNNVLSLKFKCVEPAVTPPPPPPPSGVMADPKLIAWGTFPSDGPSATGKIGSWRTKYNRLNQPLPIAQNLDFRQGWGGLPARALGLEDVQHLLSDPKNIIALTIGLGVTGAGSAHQQLTEVAAGQHDASFQAIINAIKRQRPTGKNFWPRINHEDDFTPGYPWNDPTEPELVKSAGRRVLDMFKQALPDCQRVCGYNGWMQRNGAGTQLAFGGGTTRGELLDPEMGPNGSYLDTVFYEIAGNDPYFQGSSPTTVFRNQCVYLRDWAYARNKKAALLEIGFWNTVPDSTQFADDLINCIKLFPAPDQRGGLVGVIYFTDLGEVAPSLHPAIFGRLDPQIRAVASL